MIRRLGGKSRCCLLCGSLLAVALWSLPLRSACQDSGAERDAWQHPQEVMDALGLRPGSVVADVGSGSGYFTFHLAARVGAQGKVYAEDIRDEELARIRERVAKEGLSQVEVVLGSDSDPHLPAGALDAVLVMNAYHEMRQYDAMLQAMHRALKPGGLLAIIDGVAPSGKPRESYFEIHRIPAEIVREDARRNGFRFLRDLPGFVRPEGKKEFFFVLLEKPQP
jgi:predicted methyltransferase